jgi:hypothetical protein
MLGSLRRTHFIFLGLLRFYPWLKPQLFKYPCDFTYAISKRSSSLPLLRYVMLTVLNMM